MSQNSRIPDRKAFLAAVVLLPVLTAACASNGVDFEPIGAITRIDVNNAVGTFEPESVHDPRKIANLVEIMNRNRRGWTSERRQTLGVPAEKCAYGVGFYRIDTWIAGVSLGSDGATVSRAQTQFSTLTAYKSDPEMVRTMLAILGKRL